MKNKVAAFIAVLVVSAFCAEGALRLQQLAGPIYDLNMKDVTLDGLSDVVNHKPIEGSHTERLVGRAMFGKVHGHLIEKVFDEYGIRVYRGRTQFGNCAHRKTMLFLGDSFIEGYDDVNTIPYRVAERLASKGLCVDPLNAGLSSYSPAILVPQARMLLPKLKPDYVVVSIDETDLFDDNVRYKDLIQRDSEGRNIGVRASPQLYTFLQGFIDIRSDPFYLSRLIRKLYHVYVTMPPLFREVGRKAAFTIFQIAKMDEDEARVRFYNEVEFFKLNIAEL